MKEYTYKNASTLSKTLLVFLVLGVFLNAVAVFGSYLEYELLTSIHHGVEITEAEANTNFYRLLTVGSPLNGSLVGRVIDPTPWRVIMYVDAR